MDFAMRGKSKLIWNSITLYTPYRKKCGVDLVSTIFWVFNFPRSEAHPIYLMLAPLYPLPL